MGENMCGKNQKTRWSIKDILKPQMKRLKNQNEKFKTHKWRYWKTQINKLKTHKWRKRKSTNEEIEKNTNEEIGKPQVKKL